MSILMQHTIKYIYIYYVDAFFYHTANGKSNLIIPRMLEMQRTRNVSTM